MLLLDVQVLPHQRRLGGAPGGHAEAISRRSDTAPARADAGARRAHRASGCRIEESPAWSGGRFRLTPAPRLAPASNACATPSRHWRSSTLGGPSPAGGWIRTMREAAAQARPGRREPRAGVDVEPAAAQLLPPRVVGVAEHDDRRVDQPAQPLRHRAHRQLRGHHVLAEPARDRHRGEHHHEGGEQRPADRQEQRAAAAIATTLPRPIPKRSSMTIRPSRRPLTVSGVRASRSIAAATSSEIPPAAATSASRARCSRRRRSRRLNERCSRRAANSARTNRA